MTSEESPLTPLSKPRVHLGLWQWLGISAFVIALIPVVLFIQKQTRREKFVSALREGRVIWEKNYFIKFFSKTDANVRDKYIEAIDKGDWGNPNFDKMWDDCALYVADHPEDTRALAALGEGLNIRDYSKFLSGEKPRFANGQLLIANAVSRCQTDPYIRAAAIRWWVQGPQERERFITISEMMGSNSWLEEEHLFNVFLYNLIR